MKKYIITAEQIAEAITLINQRKIMELKRIFLHAEEYFDELKENENT